MTATFSEARDEIFSLVKEAWEQTSFEIFWPDKPNEKPKTRTPWARVSLVHSTGGQATLSTHEGVSRWSRTGFLTVQIFTPAGEGLSETYELAKLIIDAVEGKSTQKGIWFLNSKILELGIEHDWFQMNVTSEFRYEELK